MMLIIVLKQKPRNFDVVYKLPIILMLNKKIPVISMLAFNILPVIFHVAFKQINC